MDPEFIDSKALKWIIEHTKESVEGWKWSLPTLLTLLALWTELWSSILLLTEQSHVQKTKGQRKNE